MSTLQIAPFRPVADQLKANFTKLRETAESFYHTAVDKDALWDAYITTFPEADGIRQSFVCNSCRSFIKHYGNLVTLKNGVLTSIWDFEVADPTYQTALNRMSALVKAAPIRDVFLTDTLKLGCESNTQLIESTITRWFHFSIPLPKTYPVLQTRTIETKKNDLRTGKQVLKRALDELKPEATEIALDLINQGALYRGNEHRSILETFLRIQQHYALVDPVAQDLFCWEVLNSKGGHVARIRNSAIGTLLIDISEDVDLDTAVRKFEKVMAPSNYKRPAGVITSKRMLEEAERTLQELGLINSLGRRFAVLDDVNASNKLFTGNVRSVLQAASVFDELRDELPVNPRSLSRVAEVTLNDFLAGVLPNATSIEVLFENRHSDNLVSLIAPQNMDAPSLFKWDNGFSWSYTGSVADSMKQRVKAAGGQIQGELRCSLAWDNTDDLDLHLLEPDGNEIWFHKRKSNTGGYLDVDANAFDTRTDPVENIIYPYSSRPLEGEYKLIAHQFTVRNRTNFGFRAEVEWQNNGDIYHFEHSDYIPNKGQIVIAEFTYSRAAGLKFKNALPTVASRKVWGLNTNQFQQVTAIMLSPNYWDVAAGTGNRHFFFMLEGAENTDVQVHGFYNEFLKNELLPHKRVFEVLGQRMKVASQPHDRQLSGLGFSDTQRNYFYARVKGSFERTIKVTI